jgi:hypothetical protein
MLAELEDNKIVFLNKEIGKAWIEFMRPRTDKWRALVNTVMNLQNQKAA